MKTLLITASMLALAASHVHAYQTGSLSCQRIGGAGGVMARPD